MRDTLRRKLFIFGFPLLSVVLIGASFLTRDDSFDTRSSASDSSDVIDTVSDSEGLPTVASINPTVARVGEAFSYYLRVVDSDDNISDLDIEIIESPDWMIFDRENLVLYGTPVLGDSDTQKTVLELSDDEHTTQYKFYLLVLDDGENS